MALYPRRFRVRKTHRAHTLHPLAIVGICLAAAIILTLAAGLLLRRLVDDDTYARLTEGETEAAPLPTPDNKLSRAVNAYPFTLGEDTTAMVAKPAATVLLNSPDGTLSYTSEVASYLGLTGNEAVSLHTAVADLSTFVPYISGIFYPQAPAEQSPDLQYTKALEEGALLREFLRAGGREIVLCSLSLEPTEAEQTLAYIRAVKSAVGNAPVGVAVSPATAANENWELLSALEDVCDFLVLDLRGEEIADDESDENSGISLGVSARLRALDYPITAYSMRPLVDETQARFISTFETTMYPNYQIVRAS